MKRSCYGIRRASLGLCLAFCFCRPMTSDATTREKETLTRPDSRLRVLRFSSIGRQGNPVSVTSGRCSSVVDAMLLQYCKARYVKGGGDLMWVDMLMISVVKPQPGDRILNACAAPGGKTLFMASCLKRQGRLRILGETAKSHQVVGLITTIHSDLRVFAKTKEVQYDKLLLDAPCSGIGVLSKPGGFLIYSTCSIDPEENQGRVEAFLLRHPEFSVDPVDRLVPSSFVTSQGVFLSNPVKHSLDGVFAARLVRAL
ncbi:hypothetical protein YC2023_100294 [Brassica napus]